MANAPSVQLKLKSHWTNLDKAFAELEGECEAVVRGMSVEMWDRILAGTPQFSGGMAASYTYSVDAPIFEDRTSMFDVSDDITLRETGSGALRVRYADARSKGDLRAINVANSFSAGNELAFRLGQTIFIANGAPYSEDVETGQVNLRPVNRPGDAIRRAVNFAAVRYASNVSVPAAERLKTLKIG